MNVNVRVSEIQAPRLRNSHAMNRHMEVVSRARETNMEGVVDSSSRQRANSSIMVYGNEFKHWVCFLLPSEKMNRLKFWLIVAAAAWVTFLWAVYLHGKQARATSLPLVCSDKAVVEKLSSHLKSTITETIVKSSDFNFTKKGYIVCNSYFGQQGSAIRTLVFLQCWAASFSLPMKIVEPFVEGNVRTTLPKGVDPLTAGKMSDFFDLEYFNIQSQLQHEPTLIPWEDFSADIPKNVIVLSVDRECGENQTDTYADIQEKWMHSNYSVVSVEGRQCFNQHYMENNLLKDMKLCVVRIVDLYCVNTSAKQKQMYHDIFQDWDPRNTTLVLKCWRGLYSFQNPDVVKHCQDSDYKRMRNKIRANKKLLSDVQYYKDHFLRTQNKPKVAVMIRAERIFYCDNYYEKESKDRVSVLGDCLRKTLEVIHNISYSELSKDRDSGGIFLTMDVGKFGTVAKKWLHFIPEGRKEEITHMVENMVEQIYYNSTNMSFADWENSFIAASRGVENPGYVAALQRALASQADCLILMGGGNFQLLAFNDYLEQHPDESTQCVHLLCIAEEFMHLFQT